MSNTNVFDLDLQITKLNTELYVVEATRENGCGGSHNCSTMPICHRPETWHCYSEECNF